MTPIDRLELEGGELMAAHPPRIENRNKRVVFGIAMEGAGPRGRIGYSRWRAAAVPGEAFWSTSKVAIREGFFDYVDEPGVAAASWHMNFADGALFGFYGGSLFAQDEIQTAEHPALGSVREALLARGLAASTVERDGATPVLVTGVERRCRVATEPNAAEGRPRGLYGNLFAGASEGVVRVATTRIDPPTTSNIVAIAAPRGGSGRYTRREIAGVMETAYSGFRAAVLESGAMAEGVPVVMHTGFWGCGVFGGNRALMCAVQIAAASAAGVATIVFHVGTPEGRGAVEEARARLAECGLGQRARTLAEVVDALERAGYEWGRGDGN